MTETTPETPEPTPQAALEGLAAEASAPQDAPPAAAAGGITLTLEGRRGSAELTVLPILDWGDDAMACLKQNDLRGWAAAVLDAESLQKWAACAPTIRQGAAFFQAWDAAVPDQGESAAS